MLGCFLCWSIASFFLLDHTDPFDVVAGPIALMLIVVPYLAGRLNMAVERVVYRPLRNAPRLAPLVSAIGVSFIFMNIGEFWGGPSDRSFPALIPKTDLLPGPLRFTLADLMVIAVTVPSMTALTLFVKYSRLGTAMRATAQDRVAAQLMGIPSDRVIGATFFIGGALAGIGSVVYVLYINIINYQLGFQNGLYAFTAAVLGGIGKIPGAVLGGLLIGLTRALGTGYIGERWTSALVFLILIVILIFRPAGILGTPRREKV
jgi:branched-chain amino acid transport system permease protein